MYQEILKQAGLSENEAIVYEALLDLGMAKASQIAPKTPLKRSLVYKILEDLVKKGLVSQDIKEGKKRFQVEPPDKLLDFVENLEQNLVAIKRTLILNLPRLKSKYYFVREKPIIRFYEGKEGLKKIYEDILNEGKDYLRFRAKHHPIYEKEILPEILEKFLKERLRKKIKIEAITPYKKSREKSTNQEDKKILNFRTWIPEKFYDAPVEINIYGNKIAILSFGKELIGTVIESPQVAKALKQIFYLAKRGAESI